jgi:hypothetical protein
VLVVLEDKGFELFLYIGGVAQRVVEQFEGELLMLLHGDMARLILILSSVIILIPNTKL